MICIILHALRQAGNLGQYAYLPSLLLLFYSSVSQTFLKWGPLLLVRMFYGPPFSCRIESKLFEILNYSVWYAINVNYIFSVFFGLVFNLRGLQGQNPRITCSPWTTVWETLFYSVYSCLSRDLNVFLRTTERVTLRWDALTFTPQTCDLVWP
jgi:hypothetical protein